MKNDSTTFHYDMDELVRAYPDQEFLQASQARAWKGVLALKEKDRKIIVMKRFLSIAAAVILIIAGSWGIILQDQKLTGNSVQASMAIHTIKTIDIPKAGIIKPSPGMIVGKAKYIERKKNTDPDNILQQPENALAIIPKEIKTVDTAFKKSQYGVALPVSFHLPDSSQAIAPIIKKQRPIPPSTNELFDGMQKLANSKLKPHRSSGSKQSPGNILPANNPDTLFPSPYN